MNQNLKTILISLGILIVFIASGILFNSYKDRQLVKETTLRVESEMRFKQLVVDSKKWTAEKDSLKSTINDKQILIDYLENNPQIIIQKNDAQHINISSLNAYNSIMLFTNNISKYESNRNRYNFHNKFK